ncbi:MAG: hypothetical protein ACE5HC_04280 [Candidatus Binatia bacterium]
MGTVEWRSPASEIAVRQFEIAAERLKLDPNVAARLKRPDRTLIVSGPTRVEGGSVHVSTGYRIQQRTADVCHRARAGVNNNLRHPSLWLELFPVFLKTAWGKD